MDEAKNLVNMAVSAMFAAMILVSIGVLLGLGYTMWQYFSRQDQANQQMKDYVNYVAYDGTTVRGQEVLSLFDYANNEGLFICVYTGTGFDSSRAADQRTIDEISCGWAIENNMHFYVPSNCPMDTIRAGATNIPTSDVHYAAALQGVKDYLVEGGVDRFHCCLGAADCTDYDTVLKIFTGNYNGWTHLSDGNNYAAFKSLLVYDSVNSTDVIGVVLIKAPTDTFYP